jgi:PAS domain S-box-containing protein
MEHNGTILIVDDEPAGRDALQALLTAEGYNLAFAGNGAEALAKAAELTPDLILLDVMMPGMDGFEVCRRLRADPLLAEVPVIMVTALDDSDSRLQGIEAGADDFVSKPFNRVELRARVRTITRLNRHRRLRALELQAERDRTRSILEALGEAVVVADVEGTIQYINPTVVALTGFTRGEALGQNWHLWQSDRQSADFYTQMEEAIHAGQTWRGEVINKRKDGTPYDAMLTVAPLFDPHDPNQPVGFVSVQRDITPLKEAERLKDRFVSNVSHELSTPLSVITLLSDNLDALYERLSDDKRRKMIRDIQKHTQVLNNLIDDVLEISRLDSGRVPMERQEVNLAQLAREEVEKQLPLAQKNNQTLCLTGVERLVVWGDGGQLRQVIRNLLNNAIKYTPAGGQITCECLVQAAGAISETAWPGSADLSPGRWAALRVADNGPGISRKDLPHLFERFYRVKTQGNIRGTGLGLSIARELIELHDGQIAVASTPGEGSTFAVYLPLLEEWKYENKGFHSCG